MTFDEIQMRVDSIRDAASDYEIAHGWEDSLRRDFIAYVVSLAESNPNLHTLAQKAKMVLTTDKIEFARHCA